MSRRFVRLAVASVLGAGLAAAPAFAVPGSFPSQGTDNASNQSHCHIVIPASSDNQAGFTITNPSEHSGGHAHGAPFAATAC
jgi:hypothetical protein